MKKFFVFALLGLVVLPGAFALAVEQNTVAPRTAPEPKIGTDIIQFNNLVVKSVSGTSAPAEIFAVSAAYSYAGTKEIQSSGIQTAPKIAADQMTACTRFENQDAKIGSSVTCPTPPSPSPLPSPTPQPIMPPQYQYRIQISADTILMLRNRAAAALSHFEANDTINVFGYYNQDGTIRGLIVRNLSKPEEKQFVQLNNVEVVNVAENSFTVIHRMDNGCTVFGGEKGEVKTNRPCPMGASISDSANPNTGLALARKYEVRYGARTIFLDRNRGTIPPQAVATGHKLNIYGATSENQAQLIDAEIIRDLSMPYAPPAPSSMSGTVTQVMGDGSFIIKTEDGRMLTVQSPIQTGTILKLKGILDGLTNTVSQVSEIMLRSGDGLPKTGPVIREISPNAGPVGTLVTIRGENFTPSGNNVHFANVKNAVTGLNSPDGKTLAFPLPATPCATGMYCAQVLLAPGAYSLSVTNEKGTSNAVLFKVTEFPSFSIATDAMLPKAVQNQKYEASIKAQGGTGSYGWKIESGSLPPGLTLNSAMCLAYPCRIPASITGIPTISGTYTFTLVLQSDTATTAKTFTLVVL